MSFKVLVVCTGNTCRSPMGEGILKKMLSEIGENEVEVSSAGISTFPGWEASPEAVEACRQMQVDIAAHRSSSINLERVRRSDLILVMESHHRASILENEPMAAAKVRLLGEFDPTAPRVAIDDPVGQPLPVFLHCADRIANALKGVVKELPKMKAQKAKESKRIVKIAIGADHRGYPLKQRLIERLTAQGCEIADCGTYDESPADHPDQAFAVAELVRERKVDRGILICSNGVGMCIAANKVPGVYAALIGDEKNARQARQHNGANVICLPGDALSDEQAGKVLEVFLTTETENGDGQRYLRRRNKIVDYEKNHYREEFISSED